MNELTTMVTPVQTKNDQKLHQDYNNVNVQDLLQDSLDHLEYKTKRSNGPGMLTR